MATVIRAKISEKNKYWIDKHRHYELKHFCLQYPMWKKAYADLTELSVSLSKMERESSTNIPGDPTAYTYILRAVTEELSYTYLKTRLEIPCGRDMYYDRYRRFFWLLSESRG